MPLLRRRARLYLLLASGALLAGGVAALSQAGRFLAREDPLRPADVIFVLAGTRVERPLEAADLFRDGFE